MTTTLLLGHVFHGAGGDALVAGQAGAVQQVEGLALGHVLVGVDQAHVADDAAALQGEGRHAADQAAAADDADFHDDSPVARSFPRSSEVVARLVPPGLAGRGLIAACPRHPEAAVRFRPLGFWSGSPSPLVRLTPRSIW